MILDVIMACRQENGFLKAWASPHLHLRPIQPGRFTVSQQQVLHDRLVDRPQQRPAFVCQGDQGAEEVAVADEVLGAVDRGPEPI